MHETDAFRKRCRDERIARWWVPYTYAYMEYRRTGLLLAFIGTQLVGLWAGYDLESANKIARDHGYQRISEEP